MQEEVHRFAITGQRHKRHKATYISVLDGIKGLGKKRQALLLKAYVSLDALKNVSLDELSQIIPPDVAMRVQERLNTIQWPFTALFCQFEELFTFYNLIKELKTLSFKAF